MWLLSLLLSQHIEISAEIGIVMCYSLACSRSFEGWIWVALGLGIRLRSILPYLGSLGLGNETKIYITVFG